MAVSSEKTQRELTVIRDTVESIWVAIVLAFVLRAFMFEAFVIPTGSMAPRLVGEHWDLVCPSCGLEYAFGYDKERPLSRGAQEPPRGARCPQCDYPHQYDAFVNGGDRVLVLKYIYDFVDPRPWDVVVFKNPQNNRENYIKRLIGLPGEMIEIVQGDIFYRTGKDFDANGVIDEQDFEDPRAETECPWRIRRKERKRVQDAMWQIVYDNDYRPNMEMIRRFNVGKDPDYQARAPKWRPEDIGKLHWKKTEAGRRFVFDGHDEQCEMHFEIDGRREVFGPRYGYNPERPDEPVSGLDVCSDLSLSFTFAPRRADSCVSLVLTSFHHRFRAEVRADGKCTLFHRHPDVNDGREYEWKPPVTIRPLEIGRGHKLALWHVDHRVTLWVDDKAVLQSTDAEYHPEPTELKELLEEIARQLSDTAGRRRREVLERLWPAPEVCILAEGGPCELSHVSLTRDVYYTYQPRKWPTGDVFAEHAKYLEVERKGPGWGVTGNPIVLKKHLGNPDLNEFYVLGDNSPSSLDSRCWMKAAPTLRLRDEQGRAIYTLGTVPRYALIGRALFVYWPSGFRIPGLKSLPFVPNVGRMRLVR